MDKIGLKDKKYSIIGDILLNISSRIHTSSNRDNFISNYFKTNSKKQVFKDFWFCVSVSVFIYMAYWVTQNVDSLVVPRITDRTTGLTVEGNCEWIQQQYKDLQEARTKSYKLLPKDIMATMPNATLRLNIGCNMTCPQKECPTTIPTTTTTLVCQERICVCPEQEPCTSGLSREQTYQSINIRPGPNNSPAYSGGCYDCLRTMWDIAGIPTCDKDNPDKGYCVPRFNPAPQTGFYQHITNKNKTTDCTVSFMDADCDGRFTINNSIWAIWGNGSIKTVYRMD